MEPRILSRAGERQALLMDNFVRQYSPTLNELYGRRYASQMSLIQRVDLENFTRPQILRLLKDGSSVNIVGSICQVNQALMENGRLAGLDLINNLNPIAIDNTIRPAQAMNIDVQSRQNRVFNSIDRHTLSRIYKMDRSQIFNYFNTTAVDRAGRTALNESRHMLNRGVEIGWIFNASVNLKQWHTTFDEKTCQWCPQFHGTRVSLGRYWATSGQDIEGSRGNNLVAYGNISVPPIHPFCRCQLIPVFS